MGRSQRHKVLIQGGDSAGKGLSEKQPAIVYIRQNAASQTLTVPLGPSGGPLKGSSIAGYPPTLFPAPGLLAERDGELREGEGAFTAPGQFNLSGNPLYTDLPLAGEGPTEPPPDPEEPPVEPPTEPPLAPDQTLPEPELEEPPAPERTVPEPPTETEPEMAEYPVGPLNISDIDPSIDPPGAWFRVPLDAGGDALKPLDQLFIEATGNTALNGDHTALFLQTVNGKACFFVRDVQIANSINNRGRVTIVGGARDGQ